jgi:hypothetical protein
MRTSTMDYFLPELPSTSDWQDDHAAVARATWYYRAVANGKVPRFADLEKLLRTVEDIDSEEEEEVVEDFELDESGGRQTARWIVVFYLVLFTSSVFLSF